MTSTRFKFVGGGSSLTTSFIIGPMTRIYHSTGLFGELSVGFGIQKDKFTGYGPVYDDKYNQFAWALGGGYAIFLNDNVALEPMIRYSFDHIKDDVAPNDKTKTGAFEIMIGFNIYLGR